MTITLTRTNSQNPEFLMLVDLLDRELLDMYGDEMEFYGQYNKVDRLNNCVVAYLDGTPAGCGAIKEYEPGVAEVKRMFVDKAARGKGISRQILANLETWAKELGFKQVILETGELQAAAIALYKSMAYSESENYGQYIGAPSSVCFAKNI